MYCQNCGTEIPDHSRFCLECGFQVSYRPPRARGRTDVTPQPNDIYSPPVTQHPARRSKVGLVIFSVIILLLLISFFGASVKNGCDNRRNINRQLAEVRGNLEQLEQSSDRDTSYFIEYAHAIAEARVYDQLESEIAHHERVFSTRAEEFVTYKWTELRSQSEPENLDLESITGRIIEAIGFDYNNLDMTDDEILALDFTEIHEGFDPIAEEYDALLAPGVDELSDLKDIAIAANLSDDLQNEINSEYDRLNEMKSKVESVQRLLFYELQSRQTQLIYDRDQAEHTAVEERLKSQYESRYFNRGYYQYEVEQKMARDGFRQIDSYFCEAPDGSNQVKQEFELIIEENGESYRVFITLQPSYGLGSYYFHVSAQHTD